MKPLKSIGLFAAAAFLLLGVLFGMQIMSFVFSQINPSNNEFIADVSNSVVNESGAWLNSTTYTVSNSAASGFSGLTITEAFNATDGTVIGVGNFTVSGTGFTNSSAATWEAVNFSYSYNSFSNVRDAANEVSNNSLQGIVTYTSQSTTQFNTVSIAITLAILVALFLLFWVFFIKNKKSETPGGNFG